VAQVNVVKLLAVICAFVVGLLAALYAGLYSLFDGLSTSKVAAMVLFLLVALVGGALLVIWLAGCVWRTRQGTSACYGKGIDGDWQPMEMPDYWPPQARLPAPTVITVPRYATNGTAQPYGMIRAVKPVELQTINQDGQMLNVPLDKLVRFLSLPTPTRTEWRGKREIYSQCLAFCETHGLLTRTPNGGAAWRAEYPPDSRRAWALQFDHSPTRSGDRPEEAVF
jgi:hypothetical protein